jgi:hypothetical protein
MSGQSLPFSSDYALQNHPVIKRYAAESSELSKVVFFWSLNDALLTGKVMYRRTLPNTAANHDSHY